MVAALRLDGDARWLESWQLCLAWHREENGMGVTSDEAVELGCTS
jgi:hypothetical protein